MFRRLTAIALLAMIVNGALDEASAQDIQTLRRQVNQGTITLLTGGTEYVAGTYAWLARDLNAVLDGENELCVLPVMGSGAVQNVRDLLFLRGIDISVVPSDVLTFIRNQNQLYPVAQRKLRYLTKLDDEVIHVIAYRDVQDVNDLTGKKVTIGPSGSDNYLRVQRLFSILHIKPEVMHHDWPSAVEKLRSGELAAMVCIAPKPSPFVQEIPASGQLHFLPLPAINKLLKLYVKTDLTDEDYPTLVMPGTRVQTLQVAAVLAVYDWPRGHKRYPIVSRFVQKLFENIEALKHPPYNPMWQKIDLEADVPGWKRLRPAPK